MYINTLSSFIANRQKTEKNTNVSPSTNEGVYKLQYIHLMKNDLGVKINKFEIKYETKLK